MRSRLPLEVVPGTHYAVWSDQARKFARRAIIDLSSSHRVFEGYMGFPIFGPDDLVLLSYPDSVAIFSLGQRTQEMFAIPEVFRAWEIIAWPLRGPQLCAMCEDKTLSIYDIRTQTDVRTPAFKGLKRYWLNADGNKILVSYEESSVPAVAIYDLEARKISLKLENFPCFEIFWRNGQPMALRSHGTRVEIWSLTDRQCLVCWDIPTPMTDVRFLDAGHLAEVRFTEEHCNLYDTYQGACVVQGKGQKEVSIPFEGGVWICDLARWGVRRITQTILAPCIAPKGCWKRANREANELCRWLSSTCFGIERGETIVEMRHCQSGEPLSTEKVICKRDKFLVPFGDVQFCYAFPRHIAVHTEVFIAATNSELEQIEGVISHEGSKTVAISGYLPTGKYGYEIWQLCDRNFILRARGNFQKEVRMLHLTGDQWVYQCANQLILATYEGKITRACGLPAEANDIVMSQDGSRCMYLIEVGHQIDLHTPFHYHIRKIGERESSCVMSFPQQALVHFFTSVSSHVCFAWRDDCLIYNLDTRCLVASLGEYDNVKQVSPSPDGRYLQALFYDGTVKVWGIKAHIS